MAASGKTLWPYGTPAALAAAAAVFVIGLPIIFVSSRAIGWPDEADVSWVVLVLLFLSLTPVALVLLDFLAERKAILGSWFNIDLSGGGLALKAAAETEVLPGGAA